jgi:hypothetical protein
MAFHQAIQRLLLIGIRLSPPTQPSTMQPPPALVPLIAAIAPVHRAFNLRAIDCGHRYRSAFWAIYLLSALAVLFAGLPLALGWDDAKHDMYHLSGAWVVGELVVISLVGLIYWLGHHRDWQGQWLAARTQAELAWYLPLIAPLIDFSKDSAVGNWYARLFSPGQNLQAGNEIEALCIANTPLARKQLGKVWADPAFITAYARWTADLLEAQRLYHRHIEMRQHALLHRVHAINTWLFGLTAVAALAHLLIHSRSLTLATTFFPALGASLHGALAQSEAYRLEAASARLAAELERAIAPIRQFMAAANPVETAEELRATVLSAIALILDEHEDWHMLVRPHHLPLG